MATDTVLNDTPAIHDGSTMAQFFVGKDTLVCDAYGIKSQKQLINFLHDISRQEELWTPLSVMVEKYEISKTVADLLRSLFINSMNLNLISSIKTKLSNSMGLSRDTSIPL